MPRDGSTIGHHTSLSTIARSGCSKFLVRSSVIGFRCSVENEKFTLTEETRLLTGEVLRVLDTQTKTWKTLSSGNDKSKRPSSAETKYLRCLDHKKQEICIPLAHPGKFYVIADKGSKIRNAVYPISQIMSDVQLPVNVRLLLGMAPLEGFHTEGVFRLTKTVRPDTFVTEILNPEKQIFLELPFDYNVKYVLQKNNCNSEQSNEASDRYFYYLVGIKQCERRYQSTELDNGYATFGLMSNPFDMVKFRSPKLFPSQTDEIPENWPITFRDPDMEELENVNVIKDKMGVKLVLNETDSDKSRPGMDVSNKAASGHRYQKSKLVHDTVRARREAKC